ncbi:TetR family transcriptional regulator [Actinorhabdospora filicis]|uniref:TetR family transcriptional regulator n=1 Tax=Actinorhabdospora filicis TaxID=1785913 RepID=A0A9W6SF05_9ACTN|nr:TetR/AcrR family transcriptional regulator [Actinorhabdospora filicis]GLZ75974.1 TetR family transcriptional regulator [Actinorhabdospora filicis]
MGRLSRAEQQERNRERVLSAALEEFARLGYREAKIDAIAERAELTRGAVYSNFPGKRALYFAVLADLAERVPDPPSPPPDATVRDALGAVARARLAGTPVLAPERLRADLIPEVLADERTRLPFAQLLRLEAILLGLTLENLPPRAPRRVRLAETLLATLHGAVQLTAAPGFIEPFDIVSACEQMAGFVLTDQLDPPVWAEFAPKALPADQPTAHEDGIVAVLGLHRLEAVEDAFRAAPRGTEVTVLIVTGDPGELGQLARLHLAELRTTLLTAAHPKAFPPVRLILDPEGRRATELGATAVSDATEIAARVHHGRIVSIAEGRGAVWAVAAG